MKSTHFRYKKELIILLVMKIVFLKILLVADYLKCGNDYVPRLKVQKALTFVTTSRTQAWY